MNKGICALSW